MSYSREDIASFTGIDEEDVKCDNCDYSNGFECEFWKLIITDGAFCTFFKMRKDIRKNMNG